MARAGTGPIELMNVPLSAIMKPTGKNVSKAMPYVMMWSPCS
jgi:hypothetical protein